MDWDEISADSDEFIQIQGIPVPYLVFDNEDDITSKGGSILSQQLEESLGLLYQRYRQKTT